jgi:hypothetical protein
VLNEDFPKNGASLWKDWYCVLKKPAVDSGSNDLMREILISQCKLTEIDFKPVETVGPLTLHLNSIKESQVAM